VVVLGGLEQGVHRARCRVIMHGQQRLVRQIE